LTNVVLNAVDACRTGGEVSLGVARARVDGREFVEIAVSDTGSGIPPAALDRIWEPYVTTKPGGTGLGLAIVRQTITAHDGFVTAESAVGRGTTIRLYLPASSAATPAAAIA
jgi:signal transduction histidine kinase